MTHKRRERSHVSTSSAPAKDAPAANDSETPSLYLPDANPPRKRLWLLLLAAILWGLCIAGLMFVAMQHEPWRT